MRIAPRETGGTSKPKAVALAWLLGFLLLVPARADRSPDIFDTEAAFEAQLRAPWRTLLRERDTPTEMPGELVYEDPSGDVIRLDARVKLRGLWRLRNCPYPPMRIRLDAGQIAPTVLAGQTVLHASVPCHRNRKYEEHIVQEYFAYRIYQLLSEQSLRVRLLRLDYWDTEKDRSIGTIHAFLVEDFDLAAERLGKRRVTSHSVPRAALEPGQAALLSLFQFMIGHTDWSIVSGPTGEECCHNAVLLGPSEGPARSGLVPIPFDFDASGLVDTGDMGPSRHLRIQNVRQRLYRGFCDHNPELPDAIATVRERRSDIERLIESTTVLRPAARRRSLRYLETFYALLDDPTKLEAQTLAKCRVN